MTTEAPKQEEVGKEEVPSEEEIRKKILASASKYVLQWGWTTESLSLGARDEGLSAYAHGRFQRGPIELVEYVQDQLHEEWLKEVRAMEIMQEADEATRLAKAIHTRLLKQAPYLTVWPDLLALQAQPFNAAGALQRLAKTADSVCEVASPALPTDLAYYSKRTLVGGVYAVAEVHMLTDYSVGFTDTLDLLGRRLRDALQTDQGVRSVAEGFCAVAGQAGEGVSAGIMRAVQALKVKG